VGIGDTMTRKRLRDKIIEGRIFWSSGKNGHREKDGTYAEGGVLWGSKTVAYANRRKARILKGQNMGRTTINTRHFSEWGRGIDEVAKRGDTTCGLSAMWK